MNKIKTAIAILALAAFLPACNTTPKKVAYQTLSAVGLSVQKAMQAAATAKVQNQIAPDDWAKIVDLHDNQYLPAYRTACDLAGHDYSTFAPADLIGLQMQLLTIINQLVK